MPRYRSTGQEINAKKTLTDEEIEERRKHHPRYQRDAALEEIAKRREAEQLSAPQAYDRSIEHLKYLAPDLDSDPVLAQRFVIEREAEKERAFREGRAISDWHTFHTKIADKVRSLAGMPSGAEQERAEALEAMKRSRITTD